jgi:hypothetical protein
MSANDILIVIVFAVAIAYGYLIGRTRVMSLMIGGYIGLFIAQNVTPEAMRFLINSKVTNNDSSTIVSIVLLLVVVLFFQFKSNMTVGDGAGRGVLQLALTGVYSFLTAGLLADGVIRLLPLSQQESFDQSSRFISEVMNYHALWLIAPLGIWILLSMLRRFG